MHTQKFLRQRLSLLVLPLIVAFFMTVVFIALGGGKSGKKVEGDSGGLNLKLPDAHFKKGGDKDKLSLYEEAKKDSAMVRDAIKNDPYYKTGELKEIYNDVSKKYAFEPDSSGEKVTTKLNLLKNELNKKAIEKKPEYKNDAGVSRLEKMMSAINAKNETDPEVKELSGMLDKIMLIQHPEKLQDSLQKNKPVPYAVRLTNDHDSNIFSQNGFYGMDDDAPEEKRITIGAVVDETQTLVAGAVVKLRLLQDIYVNGSLIAKDQLVYGISSLVNERLKISINSIRANDNILPVSLDVYDLDGLEGIYIPGSISRDAGKQAADQAMSSVGITSFNPSLGAEAANAGLQAARTLMSKKIKLVRVSVPLGYKVLLKDNSQK